LHANLLRIEWRQGVLFADDETLFSVFVPGSKKPGFAQLDGVVREHLFKATLWYDLSQMQIVRMLQACREARFAKPKNRYVLGSLNDMRFRIHWYVESNERLMLADLVQLTLRSEPHAA
jgi:hypothetical protein